MCIRLCREFVCFFYSFLSLYPLLIGLTESKKETARLADDSKALETSQSKDSPNSSQMTTRITTTTKKKKKKKKKKYKMVWESMVES